jgi:mannitol/fructose-specific phosphotransferase system IIA component
MGKSEGKRQLERRTRRWEENFKMALQELVEEGVVSMNLVQDWNRRRPVLNTVMNIQITLHIKFEQFRD